MMLVPVLHESHRTAGQRSLVSLMSSRLVQKGEARFLLDRLSLASSDGLHARLSVVTGEVHIPAAKHGVSMLFF
jgi:hypothetical protein